METLVPGTTCKDHPEFRKRTVSLEKGDAVMYLLSPFTTLDAPFFASTSVHVEAFDNRRCLTTSPMIINYEIAYDTLFFCRSQPPTRQQKLGQRLSRCRRY